MAEEIMGEMRKSGNSKLNEILRRSRGEAEVWYLNIIEFI